MNNTAIGDFVTQPCALCPRPITRADALYPSLVRVMDFGAVAHRACFDARYHDTDPFAQPAPSPVQGQLDLFGTQEASQGSIAPPEPRMGDTWAEPEEGRWYLWWTDRSKAPVAEKIAGAVERYAERFDQSPNVVYVSEADWRRSGVQPGDEVVPGVRLFVSGYVHEFELKCGRE